MTKNCPKISEVCGYSSYIRNNGALIPNYSDRYYYGDIISTAFVESTVNELVAKRKVKKTTNAMEVKSSAFTSVAPC